jgi:glucose/mannose-6-phosphate isomerase
MLRHIKGLPRQCQLAWDMVSALSLPETWCDVRHVVVIGMGGSAMGGSLVQGLVAGEGAAPITVVRDYTLPAFVKGPGCLVIGCSHSGDTEETLAGVHQALDRGVRLIAVATGGRLAELADSRSFPLVRYECRSQPRAAVGYSMLLVLGICWRVGLVRDYSADVAEAVGVMNAWQTEIGPEVPRMRNAAKGLAARVVGRLPVVQGAGHLVAVARRWKTQLNENAKLWAFYEPMPELQHNSVVGFHSAQPVREQMAVAMLRSKSDHPRVRVRWEVTKVMLLRSGVVVEEVQARGESRLAQMLSLVHFGDFASYYAALLGDVDPTPVDAILYLKRRLAEV